MKKVIFLSLLVFCFSCESEGPEPEVTSEVVELEVEVDETESKDNAIPGDVFLVVEQMAEFEGGVDAWNNYLKNQIEYPTQARREGVEGRVFLSFIVQADGKITNAQVVRGIGAGCDEEALRVIKESPYWNPGEQRGQKVASKMSVAISFKL